MDRIALRGIRAFGRHGASPGERDRAQPFEIDAVVELDVHAAQASDDLRDTLDYATLCNHLVAIVESTSHALLERLAGDLIDAVFADARVARAEVTIAKPGILDGATPSVTLARENPHFRRHRVHIGLGANLGDPVAGVERALAALRDLGTVARRSSLYRTKPWGRGDQPDFVNAAALLETALDPRALLDALKALEVRLGRTPGEPWGPRVIDLDVLAYDDLEIDEPGLRIPHPRLRERAFVLVPLAEIDARYSPLRDALGAPELAGVALIP